MVRFGYQHLRIVAGISVAAGVAIDAGQTTIKARTLEPEMGTKSEQQERAKGEAHKETKTH